jgi:hypothetical protein
MVTDRFLICSVSGDTITTGFSSVDLPLTQGKGIAAVGDKLTTGKGRIYSFDGSDMTQVQGTSGTTDFATTDGMRFFYGGFGDATNWRLATTPYTKTDMAEEFEGTPGGGGGYVFIPRDNQAFGANIGGVYQHNGTTFAKIADFKFNQISQGDISNLVATVVRNHV